ncbi:interleukin-1 family member A [Thunnus albacares]|uniref:interleukin-1 family member A n=2 Tax=Thunnus TaxID=8234 RepID=UPI001C4D0B50|nr:interleukin-1 family member A isoform X1 [Thunnus maccoyii]XP_044209066.1 interleukin-1 family member A [Thunnus albacares]
MDQEDSVVKGSVLIVHQMEEGRHQYEVENVVKYKKASGGKPFVRGDKLMQINGMDLQNLTPEELAQTLAGGSPMLTVHKSIKMKQPIEQPSPTDDILYPVSKEAMLLSFSMEMKREGDQEESEWSKEGEGREDGGIEGNVCQPEDEENGQETDLLIISMTQTSIAVVKGRGCEDGGTCHGCHGVGCTFKDVVMVAESSMVTLVPRGGGSFRQEKKKNVLVECVASQQYLRGICSQKTLYVSPNPERITIYSYKSNIVSSKGIPVVLNLTESDCFLKCSKNGSTVLLQVETCDKQRLKRISLSDECTLSFVFYMKGDASQHRRFESALHHGWFIQTASTDSVEMATMDGHHEDQSFLFIIRT